MDAAWSQVGDVIEANRRLRAAQLVRELAVVWRTRHLAPLVASAPGSRARDRRPAARTRARR